MKEVNNLIYFFINIHGKQHEMLKKRLLASCIILFLCVKESEQTLLLFFLLTMQNAETVKYSLLFLLGEKASLLVSLF